MLCELPIPGGAPRTGPEDRRSSKGTNDADGWDYLPWIAGTKDRVCRRIGPGPACIGNGAAGDCFRGCEAADDGENNEKNNGLSASLDHRTVRHVRRGAEHRMACRRIGFQISAAPSLLCVDARRMNIVRRASFSALCRCDGPRPARVLSRTFQELRSATLSTPIPLSSAP